MDHVSKEVRSKIMATVRSTGGRTTELALGRLLWAAGLRGYRKQWPVAGKPDFAWPALKIAVFVDGCFWHGCTRCKYLPRTHTKFWRDKIETNQRRDRRVSQRLRRAGWTVIRVRECAVFRAGTLRRISRALDSRRAASSWQPRSKSQAMTSAATAR
jgi:DNA mismatch endonuclease (patch repair protein)